MFLFCFSYLKNTAFTAVKRDGACKSTYVQFVSFFNGRYTKGVPFLSKGHIKGWEVGPPGGAPPPPPPFKTLLSTRGRASCQVTSSYGQLTDTTRYSLSVFPRESPSPPDPRVCIVVSNNGCEKKNSTKDRIWILTISSIYKVACVAMVDYEEEELLTTMT